MAEASQDLHDEDLGARIRAVRELAGAGQRELAKAVGMSRRELQAAERGARHLSTEELRALAGALGVEPDVFTGDGVVRGPERAGSTPDGATDPDGSAPGGTQAPWPPAPNQATAAGAHDEPPRRTERRKDLVTRSRVDESWNSVRAEMHDVLGDCARVISAGSGSDVRELLQQLERDLMALKAQRSFQRGLADHERSLQHVRTGRRASPGVFDGR